MKTKTQKYKGYLIEGVGCGYKLHWSVTVVPPKYQIMMGVAQVEVKSYSMLFLRLVEAKAHVDKCLLLRP